MKFFDLKTIGTGLATMLALVVGRDFFFGMFLFLINLMAFKLIIANSFGGNPDELKSVKKIFFIPVLIIKFLSVGIISYLVLVSAKGSPLWYVGGFAAGVALYTLGLVLEHRVKTSER